MSSELFIPTPTMFAHYGIIALYCSIALAVLDRVGVYFGPLVRRRSPGFADFCSAAFAFMSDTFNHVFKPLLPARPAAGDVSKGGFVSRSLLFLIALATLLFLPVFANATQPRALHATARSALHCRAHRVSSSTASCPGGRVDVVAFNETPFGGVYQYACRCPSAPAGGHQ